MAVMTERPKWSDERLDDLSARVNDGFRRNDEEHHEIRREIKEGFDRMNARFDKQEARFDKQDARFEARMDRLEARMDQFQHTLFIFSGGLIGALIAAVITLVATVAS